MRYLLSIVIPVYHAEKYIRKNLSHLLAYDLTGTELIAVVCEDGFDRSAEVCKEILAGRSGTQVIIQREQGLSVARNTGLSIAAGEYVLFMDSDDFLLQDGFVSLMNALTCSGADVLVGKYVLSQEIGRDIWPAYTFPDIQNSGEARTVIYADLPDSIWNVWRYVCKRAFLLRHELFFNSNLLYCEDVDWTPRVLEASGSISFLETPYYRYTYKRPAQLSGRVDAKATLTINQIAAESIERYKGKPYYEPLCRRLIRESLFSLSNYCKYTGAERKMLLPYINACVRQYELSPDKKARLFVRTYRFIPLYCWSAALALMKALRGMFKWLLGANTARPFRRIR